MRKGCERERGGKERGREEKRRGEKGVGEREKRRGDERGREVDYRYSRTFNNNIFF
jgi:hypothetical protein